MSVSAVRAALHQIGLRWGRPRLAMPDKVNPEKAQKQWKIAWAPVEAPPGTPILYADESRLQLLPLIRAMWHWVGQQIRIPTPGTNKNRALFGALDIRTGHWTYLIRERMRKEDFLAFLERLLVTYPTGLIILIVDNYSSHTAHLVRDWLAQHERLQLHYLPKYCSHLNPVEPIDQDGPGNPVPISQFLRAASAAYWQRERNAGRAPSSANANLGWCRSPTRAPRPKN